MAKIIRFGEPIEPELQAAPQPVNNLSAAYMLKSQNIGFRVYFVKGVHDKILAHINEIPSLECGGVLVGHPFQDATNKSVFVIITGAIPQYSTNRGVAHFTVGPEETSAVRQEIEKKCPGQVAVGWYHSHPGHGIFLSGQDMVIVKSIYNASWHVALVIDPIRKEEGVFIGPDGEQLGSSGGQKLGESWIELAEQPTSVRAIALFNQAKEALEDRKSQDAKRYFDDFKQLIVDNHALSNWQSLLQVIENKDNSVKEDTGLTGEIESPVIIADMRVTPNLKPSRRDPDPASAWLIAATICTLFFSVTLGFVVFFFKKLQHC
jgi:proteasome lid subunit RPN8/RPN11